MSAPRGLAEPGDAELVAGVLAGDRGSFAAIYDRYADRLHDFCYSMLRDRQDAADATQDTFVLVAQRLGQLRDPARLRPWLYAIARSEALRRIRARSRFTSDAEVADMADPGGGPAEAVEQAELTKLVADAAAGLSDRDRALLDLHLRQGLEGAELGEAMGVSAGHAYVLLHRLREQVERSLGALLIARLGRDDCAELGAMLAGWDGRFSPLIRKRVARHVDRCDVCTARRRAAASPWALLSTVALVPAPLYLRDEVLNRVQLVAHHGTPPPESGGPPAESGGPPAGGPGPRGRPTTQAAAALVAAALVAAAGVLGWQTVQGDAADPVAADVAGPAGSSPPAPASLPPPPAGTAAPTPEPSTFAPAPAAPFSAEQAPTTAPGGPAPGGPAPGGPAPGGPADPTGAADVRTSSATPDPRLDVSPARIELAAPRWTGTVMLTNRGGATLRWSATASEQWLVVTPAGGTLAGGESMPVTLRAARDGRAVLSFDWAGGSATVVVGSTPR